MWHTVHTDIHRADSTVHRSSTATLVRQPRIRVSHSKASRRIERAMLRIEATHRCPKLPPPAARSYVPLVPHISILSATRAYSAEDSRLPAGCGMSMRQRAKNSNLATLELSDRSCCRAYNRAVAWISATALLCRPVLTSNMARVIAERRGSTVDANGHDRRRRRCWLQSSVRTGQNVAGAAGDLAPAPGSSTHSIVCRTWLRTPRRRRRTWVLRVKRDLDGPPVTDLIIARSCSCW